MVTTTKQHSITLKVQQSEWLDEHPEVSLSQIAQVGVDRQKELFESSLQFKENKALRERIAKMAETIQLMANFHIFKGLSDEYFHYSEDKIERGEI